MRAHIDIIYEAETEQFLSETVVERGSIPIGTLTRDTAVLAKNSLFMLRKVCRYGL